ncbi:MAG: DUF6311 domain-containing protein [Ruthenibacterium sp.]
MEPLLTVQKNTRRRRALLALAGAALGAALFCLCYGFSAASVTNDAWIWNASTDQDILQHYAGWLFYRDAPLSFPLGSAVSMQYPSGVGGALTFTDSVPLAGIFFRLFSGVLPVPFQYFGLWILLCSVLMGAASALLLSLFLPDCAWNNVCVLLGTCIFLLSPAMADRAFRHTALASHFLILFALYLYFKDGKEGHRWRVGWPILTALAITIHPYFLPMLFALLLADLLMFSARQRSGRAWVQSAAFLCVCMGASLLTGACIGAFNAPGTADSSYGFWTMNLDALLNPRGVGAHWSRVLPALPLTNGNIDGFQYLGLGVLTFGLLFVLVWLWGLARTGCGGTAQSAAREAAAENAVAEHCAQGAAAPDARRFAVHRTRGGRCGLLRRALEQLLSLLKRHWALCAVCAVLTLFALSHVVTLGARTLFTLPLPDVLVRLCSIFRAGGRMFWPVNYLLVLSIVVAWARRGSGCAAPAVLEKSVAVPDAAVCGAAQSAPRRFSPLFGRAAGAVCLAALLSLQAWDLAPGFAAKRALVRTNTPSDTTLLRSGAWDAMAGHYKHVFSFDNPLQRPYDVALWAAANGMTTNDTFTARYDGALHSAQTQAALADLSAGSYDADTLYFTCSFERFQTLAEALLSAGADVTCARLDGLWYVILPNRAGVSLPAEDADFTLYPHFPLSPAPYTDALWTDGVLNSDPRVILLYDNAVTNGVLSGAAALLCEGTAYPILKTDYGDPGWVMVTLDIPDAAVLTGKELTKSAT